MLPGWLNWVDKAADILIVLGVHGFVGGVSLYIALSCGVIFNKELATYIIIGGVILIGLAIIVGVICIISDTLVRYLYRRFIK